MPDGGSAPQDLRVLGPKRTREVLAYAQRVLNGEIPKARLVLTKIPRAATLVDRDDLFSEGQLAALEAAVSFDATRCGANGTWQGWVRARIRWRLQDVVKKAIASAKQEQMMPAARRSAVGIEPGGAGVSVTDQWSVMDPVDEEQPPVEETLGERQAMAFIEKNAHALLTRREQVIISKRLSGFEGTDTEMASGFGVDRSQVTRGMSSAIQKFSRAFAGRRMQSCA